MSQRLDAMKHLMGELPTLDDTYGQEQSDRMKNLLERMENLGPLQSPIDRNAAGLYTVACGHSSNTWKRNLPSSFH